MACARLANLQPTCTAVCDSQTRNGADVAAIAVQLAHNPEESTEVYYRSYYTRK